MKVAEDWRLPASRSTTAMPFWQSSLARVPPPAPEPMITTGDASSCAYWAIVRPSRYNGGLADAGGSGSQSRSLKPRVK